MFNHVYTILCHPFLINLGVVEHRIFSTHTLAHKSNVRPPPRGAWLRGVRENIWVNYNDHCNDLTGIIWLIREIIPKWPQDSG